MGAQGAQRPETAVSGAGSSPTGCSYEFPGGKCPSTKPTVACTKDADCSVCKGAPGGRCTCHGVANTCHDKVCKAGAAELCFSHASAPVPNQTVTTGGVQLFVNMQTSVVGFVAIEVLGAEGMSL
jgi:hypothetical protein